MVTIEDIKQMIVEETEKLHKIGYSPVSVKVVKLVKAVSFYADAWRNIHQIRVSEYYLNAPVEEIRATIMHELIHMVPESGNGHGFEWKAIAVKVNEAYPQYNIRRVGSNLAGTTKDFSIRQAAALEAVRSKRPVRIHIVKCTKCGMEWRRTRNSNLTLHPEQYHCNCGGSLVKVS